MRYSVYARDRKSGREYALPHRYFGNFPTQNDAEVALQWYLETSSGSARELVEVYIREHEQALILVTSVVDETRELTPV